MIESPSQKWPRLSTGDRRGRCFIWCVWGCPTGGLFFFLPTRQETPWKAEPGLRKGPVPRDTRYKKL